MGILVRQADPGHRRAHGRVDRVPRRPHRPAGGRDRGADRLRRLSLVERIAKRLPEPPPVLELDVTDDEQLASLAGRVSEHVDGLDGVVHGIGNAPATALGGNFLQTPWSDVAMAMHVSAYSLKSLAMAALPLMAPGGAIVGMDFDASVAWPAYDWMGVAKAALESTARYLARDLGPRGIRVNLMSAGPIKTMAGAASPASTSSRASGRSGRRSAGISAAQSRPRAGAWRCCRTGSPPRRGRLCTWTAARTPWVCEPFKPGTGPLSAGLVPSRLRLDNPDVAGPDIRASDAERELALARLRDGFAEGRLTHETFSHRVEEVLRARANGELLNLVADLPSPGRLRAAALRTAVFAQRGGRCARPTAGCAAGRRY